MARLLKRILDNEYDRGFSHGVVWSLVGMTAGVVTFAYLRNPRYARCFRLPRRKDSE